MTFNELLHNIPSLYTSEAIITYKDSFDATHHTVGSTPDGTEYARYWIDFDGEEIYDTADLPDNVDSVEFRLCFEL